MDGQAGEVILHTWTARKVRPIVVLYVILVFVGFMAIAYVVLHSRTAVGALATGMAGAVIPLMASILSRTEFQLTETGLRKRPVRPRKAGPLDKAGPSDKASTPAKPADFKDVFHWENLDHVKPVSSGFKFYRPLDERNPLHRFWKLHVSEAHSGEFQVEAADRAVVASIFRTRGKLRT